jgi:hypothetical protein
LSAAEVQEQDPHNYANTSGFHDFSKEAFSEVAGGTNFVRKISGESIARQIGGTRGLSSSRISQVIDFKPIPATCPPREELLQIPASCSKFCV